MSLSPQAKTLTPSSEGQHTLADPLLSRSYGKRNGFGKEKKSNVLVHVQMANKGLSFTINQHYGPLTSPISVCLPV